MIEFPDSLPFRRPASVADEIAFEALPEETRALVSRLFGHHQAPPVPPPASLVAAYKRGWEDCEGSAEVTFGTCSTVDAMEAVDDILGGWTMTDHPDLFKDMGIPHLEPITTMLKRFSPATEREFGLKVDPRSPAEGEAERDRILAEHTTRRKVLLVALNLHLEHRARSRADRTATADDAMEIIADWPEAADLDPRWTGAVWRGGPWTKTGHYVRSRRKQNHARPIPVWTLDYPERYTGVPDTSRTSHSQEG